MANEQLPQQDDLFEGLSPVQRFAGALQGLGAGFQGQENPFVQQLLKQRQLGLQQQEITQRGDIARTEERGRGERQQAEFAQRLKELQLNKQHDTLMQGLASDNPLISANAMEAIQRAEQENPGMFGGLFQLAGDDVEAMREAAKTFTEQKIESNKAEIEIKRSQGALAKLQNEALERVSVGKGTDDDRVLLKLQQPETGFQRLQLGMLNRLRTGTPAQRRLADRAILAGISGTTAEEYFINSLWAENEAKGQDSETALANAIATWKKISSKPGQNERLEALTRMGVAIAQIQGQGLPVPEEMQRDFRALLDGLFEELGVKRPPSKADILREAQKDVESGKALGVDDIIRKWQKANPGSMGRGAAPPRF
ncbi:MAG TPA: hypothetical protein VJA25_09325 [Dehalococcoidia bacterium]|nr:hypothetical protein [Dehalococcoidia bacterium]